MSFLDQRGRIVRILIALFAVAVLVASVYLPSAQTPNHTAMLSGTSTVQATAPFGVGLTTATVTTVSTGQVLETCFSPHGGCASKIMKYWDGAKNSILVAIYSFTLDTLGDALIRAHDRGVSVKVIFDSVQAKGQGSEHDKLLAAGIDVRVHTPLMHHKFCVIDGTIVISGSMNYSEAGDISNNESILVINSASVATQYAFEWEQIWNESVSL